MTTQKPQGIVVSTSIVAGPYKIRIGNLNSTDTNHAEGLVA